ncbi:MAG: YdcF family protein [Archangium sp.]
MLVSLMFFVLSKLLDVLVDPLWWCVATLVAGLLLQRHERHRRRGVLVLTSGVLLLLLASLPVVSNGLWRALERGAENTVKPDVTYDAVVLLGGVVAPLGSLPSEIGFNESFERVLATRELLLSGRAKVAILSGGSLGGALDTEAGYLAAELQQLGVPADQLIIEAKAMNTRENAVLSKELLTAHGAKQVVIVTSAFHMPRAVGCFRAVNLEVDTLPVDWRMRDDAVDQHWAPRGEYLSQTSRALREWLGRAVYRVLGYSASSA